jgi:hypothetical protein
MVGRERVFRHRFALSPLTTHCTMIRHLIALYTYLPSVQHPGTRSTFSRAAPSPSSRESTRWVTAARLRHPLTVPHVPHPLPCCTFPLTTCYTPLIRWRRSPAATASVRSRSSITPTNTIVARTTSVHYSVRYSSTYALYQARSRCSCRACGARPPSWLRPSARRTSYTPLTMLVHLLYTLCEPHTRYISTCPKAAALEWLALLRLQPYVLQAHELFRQDFIAALRPLAFLSPCNAPPLPAFPLTVLCPLTMRHPSPRYAPLHLGPSPRCTRASRRSPRSGSPG